MIDALSPAADRDETRADAALSVRVLVEPEAIGASVDRIDSTMIHSAYQHPVFLRAWLREAARMPVLIEIAAPGHDPVLLPLDIGADGKARYWGGQHANANFPPGRAADLAAVNARGGISETIRGAVAVARLPVSVIILERQLAEIEGVPNPLVFPHSVPSPNVALSITIDGDFDSILAVRSGKNKRKKNRNYRRKLDTMGEVAFHHPADKAQTDRILDRFFALKSERFEAAGIANVFGGARTEAFFRSLFGDGGASFELHALTINDDIAALIGCYEHDQRLIVEFGAFDPRFAVARPGEVLFFSAIADACRRGLSTFDFGIGDERYKRSWCDVETTHFDTTIAVSAVGQISAAVQVGRSRVVRAIKSNQTVWATVKQARRRLNARR